MGIGLIKENKMQCEATTGENYKREVRYMLIPAHRCKAVGKFEYDGKKYCARHCGEKALAHLIRLKLVRRV